MERSLGHSVLTSTAAQHLIGIAALSAFVALSPVGAAAADQTTFGEALSFSSEQKTDFNRSGDKHAFTTTFSGLELGLGNGPVPAPIVTRTYSLAIPLSDAEQGAEIPFHFQGYAFCQEGVNAYAVVSVNGQTSTINFPPGHDQSFVHSMVFKAPYAVSDVRLTILLAVERDAKHRTAEGYLNVSQIDSATDPVPAQPRIPETVETLKKKQ
jgi:hypothetical protein